MKGKKDVKLNQKDRDDKENKDKKEEDKDGKKDSKPEDGKNGKENEDKDKKKDEENQEDKDNKSFNSLEDNNQDGIQIEIKDLKYKYEEINITIEYKDDILFESKFKTTDKISSIFNLLLQKKNKYAEYDLLSPENVSISGKKETPIGSEFPDLNALTLSLIELGLEIGDDVIKDYEVSTTLLGEPLFDLGGDIGLLIYHKTDKSFTCEIVKSDKLNKYSHLSSFCNCKNNLYISGGEIEENKGRDNKHINSFSSIDLFNTESIIELHPLNHERAWHSMIFIPKKYIFIIGGDSKTVEIYDIEKKHIMDDCDMNHIRNECALCCLNNAFLYAFGGSSHDGQHLKNVERCNLRKDKRKWEMVNFKSEDNATFHDCFYVSAFISDKSMVLFVAHENGSNHYENLLIDVEKEEACIKKYESKSKINDVCPEKMFYPINTDTSVLIPLIGNPVNLYIVTKNNSEIQLSNKLYPKALDNIYG